MTSRLREALLGFDGKAVSYLSETGVRLREDPDYLPELVSLSADTEAHIAAGATWMIKAHLEAGGQLTPDLTDAWLQSLTAPLSWSAALHILQSVRFLDLSAVRDQTVLEAIERFTRHERPFLRAWATDALWRAAQGVPDLQSRARRAVARAMDDPAASVRARARQIEKDMNR